MSKKEKESMVEKIVIKYEDGTSKEIEKGAIITVDKDENEDNHLTFEFADISGSELTTLILGVMQMGVEMGLFNDEDEQ